MSFQARVHIEAIAIQLNALVFIVKSLMNQRLTFSIYKAKWTDDFQSKSHSVFSEDWTY